MEELQTLRDEIKQLIKPQKDCTPPSFSYRELIAMCLALHDEPMEPREIMAWITRTFTEYRFYAFGYFWSKLSGAYDDDGEEVAATVFMEAFMRIFRKYDFPVKRTGEKEADDMTEMCFHMSPSNVRRVLRLHPYADAPGSFRILDLPVELRTKIYDMVLCYPQAGVAPSITLFNSPTVSYTVVTRNSVSQSRFKSWNMRKGCRSLDLSTNTLSLLMVNKQIHKEALPCFYSLNTFYLGSLSHSLRALRVLPLVRCQYLRHLAFRHKVKDRSDARTFFDMVCTLPNLRKLDIWMHQGSWFSTVRSERGETFIVFTISGLDILAEKKRGITVDFSGECPDIAAYWKPKIEEQPNVQTQA